MVIDIEGSPLTICSLKTEKLICPSVIHSSLVLSSYNNIKSAVNSSEDLLIDECDIDAVIQNKPSVFENVFVIPLNKNLRSLPITL